MHLAALRGNYEVLEFLVSDFQASTSIRDKNGCTPLMLAVKKEQLRTEWVLRRLTSKNTWDLVTNLGLSRLRNKTYVSLLSDAYVVMVVVFMVALLWLILCCIYLRLE